MRGEMVATAMTSRHSNALCTRAGFINNVTIWKTKSNTLGQDLVSCGPPKPRNYTWTCKLGCFFTQQVATKSPYPLQYIIEILRFYGPNSISCSVKGCSKLMFPEQSLASYKVCDSHTALVEWFFRLTKFLKLLLHLRHCDMYCWAGPELWVCYSLLTTHSLFAV